MKVRGPVEEGNRTYRKGRSQDKTRRVHADGNGIVSNAMQSGSCWNISERLILAEPRGSVSQARHVNVNVLLNIPSKVIAEYGSEISTLLSSGTRMTTSTLDHERLARESVE